MFQGISRLFQESFNNVSTVFQRPLQERIFKGVAIMLKGSLTFLKCFKVFLRVFQGSFVFLFCFAWQSSKLPKQKEGLLSLVSLECVVHLECVGVSRKFKGCFKEIFRIFQGPFKQD